MSRGLKIALRLGGTALLLTLVLRHAPVSDLSSRLTGLTVVSVGAGVLILLFSQAVAAFRWGLVLGPTAPGWPALYRLYLVGGFFNLFLPTSVGGDAVRGASLAKATGRTAEAFSSLVADRLLGVSALVLYTLIGVLAAPTLATGFSSQARWKVSREQLLAGVAVCAALTVIAIRLLPRWPAVHRAALEAVRVFTRLASSPGLLAGGIVLGLVSQGLIIGIWAVLAWSVGIPLPIGLLLLAVPLTSLAALLPVSIGGLGVRDGAWLVLLTAAGYEAGPVVASSLLYFAVTMFAGAIGGLVFVSRGVAAELADR